MCLGVIFLTYLSSNQDAGDYRCTKISVAFGDEIWEEAYITSTNEKKLLIYSHFNGIYVEDGEAYRYNLIFHLLDVRS